MSLEAELRRELDALEAAHLLRSLRPVDPKLVNFASNDYLGLSRHPALVAAGQRATAERGTGAGASRLVTGTDAGVLALEAEIAVWKGKEAALVFGSGYAAALGAIPALVARGDTVILDKLAHACLIDGARLSGATVRTYRHNDLNRLEDLLRKTASPKARTLIITEAVFSMDGDVAPLREIVELKESYGAWLFVDEAHATGLYGTVGAGLAAECGLSSRVDVVMSTFSKALGSLGGCIAGSRSVVDWLVNRARSMVYSTALPPGVIAANRAALEIVRGAEGAALRARLRQNIERFRAGLPVTWKDRTPCSTPIQPLICVDSAAALRLSAALRERGFLIPAIRPPTVPRNAARLRVTLSAVHADKDIDGLNRCLALPDFN